MDYEYRTNSLYVEGRHAYFERFLIKIRVRTRIEIEFYSWTFSSGQCSRKYYF